MNNALTLDYERVFRVMNQCSVEFLLIGGLNYYLLHRPISTQDIDLFINDDVENRRRCELACQMAIPETARRQDRVKHLREILGQ